MTFSISSFLISLGMVFLLTLVLCFILWSRRSLKVIRLDFIVVLFSMIFFRLLLPIEFPTAITLKSTAILPSIHNLLYATLSVGPLSISVINLFCFLWTSGTIFGLKKVATQHLTLSRVVNTLNFENLLVERIDTRIVHAIKNEHIQIVQSNVVPAIVTVGVINPRIILPDITGLTDTEMNFILAHEIQHIKNKDIFLKYLLEILVTVYWWFPPVYLLRKQLELVLEMRVDSQVTKLFGDESYFDYAYALVSVSKKSLQLKSSRLNFFRNNVANFIPDSTNILKKRIDFLLDGFEIRKTNRLILTSLFIVPFFFFGIIFEPYNSQSNKLDDTFNIEDIQTGYILETEEGRFFYYNDGEIIGEVTDTTGPVFKDLPIIKK